MQAWSWRWQGRIGHALVDEWAGPRRPLAAAGRRCPQRGRGSRAVARIAGMGNKWAGAHAGHSIRLGRGAHSRAVQSIRPYRPYGARPRECYSHSGDTVSPRAPSTRHATDTAVSAQRCQTRPYRAYVF
ncbi:GP57.1 [Caviid betaherpesvirus 2]|uniref:GP57.1 n=1 Tax=Guinea pig cytomegalovirus (strain 22122) TaxID=103920 RepID=B7TPX4_GPCMV|nr:GP57.1 [Caviid betaherpesvirus 2]AGE11537.1 GP57.1 [Caviid betaherpesvirus 2]AIL83925.1 GP57.1 [BAC cloning vector GPN13BACdenovo_preserved(MM)]BAJ78526.1 GP57.1 [Caviid betaherpesvirus 2]